MPLGRIWKRSRLPLVLLAFVVLALGFSFITPLGEASDEVSHFAYVQYLAEHGRLPQAEGAVLGEARQPPLYYVLGAALIAGISERDFEVIANPDFKLDDPQTPNFLLHTRREAFPYQNGALAWHLVRALSIAMGAVTVWATWQLALEFSPGDAWLAWGAASLAAFVPNFLFLAAQVNNDNLVIMLSSLGILQVVRIARGAVHPFDAVVLGVVLALAGYAKWSGLVLWVFAFLLLALTAYQRKAWDTYIRVGLIAFGVALGFYTSWMLYNLATYGDPLGWSLALNVTDLREMPPSAQEWLQIAYGVFTSYWGRFGGVLHLKMADAVYDVLAAASLVPLLGWVGYARDARTRRLEPRVGALALCFGLFWLLLGAAFVRWTLTFAGTDQARLVFPGLSLLAVFLAAGLGRLFGSRYKYALGATSVGMFALAAGALLYLQGVFAPAAPLASAFGPRAIDFGQTLVLNDYQISRTEYKPGESISLRLGWVAARNPEENYWLLIQLMGAEGAVVNKDGVPGAGRVTTDWWKQGEAYSAQHQIPIPVDIAPGTYSLTVGVHPFGKWEWLPVRGADTVLLERVVVLPR